MKKILKKILLGILIFCVLAVISAFFAFHFFVKTSPQTLIKSIDAVLKDDISKEDIQSVLDYSISQDEQNNGVVSTQSPTPIVVSKSPTPTQQPKKEIALSKDETAAKTVSETWIVGNTISKIDPPPTPTPQPTLTPTETVAPEDTKEDTSINSQISKAKSQVSPKDFATGMSIAQKIDINYLFGLSKGGLTLEKRKEASDYLKKNLSRAEIETLKVLISKYSYLLK